MTIPFVQARWFHEGRQGHAIRLFVIHDMEVPEKGTTAESVARYFASSDRKASAHYCCDENSIVQCVHDSDTAYGAAGANTDGLHFEQAGYAKQNTEDWLDAFGLAMFETMGPVLRAKALEHNVPLRWLTVAEVADGHTRGLCTHADVSAAFPKVSTGHTDPGPNFPKDRALSIWLGHDTSEEDDMPPRYELLVPNAGDNKGQVWLVGSTTREYIDANPPVELSELEATWGVHKPINLVSWTRIVRDTVVVKSL